VSKLAPDLPREVERVVERCLRKDLDRRSQSMAEIRVALQDLKEESKSGSLAGRAGAAAWQRSRWRYYAVGGIVLTAVITALWLLWPARETTPLHADVLTSFIGYQGEPSLSPDGNQFAFTWDGDVPNGQRHVYISLVGKGTPLRLTPENELGARPFWSPDGQWIAFWRGSTGSVKSALLVMPALGGPGRRIVSGFGAGAASWSPDGKWLLWSQPEKSNNPSIHAAPAGGGEAHQLLEPPPGENTSRLIGDLDPTVSPNGRELVWSRCPDDYDCDLYLAGFQDGRMTGPPRPLTHDHKTKLCPRWTNDGKEIIYIAGEATSELAIYRVRASGSQPRRIEGIGANATYLTLAAKSNRLLYSTLSINYDIRRVDLTSPDAKPERFLSSTRYEASPSYSPDGKRIAFSSNRGGVRQIWVADADGANPVPLTSFPDGIAASPKWSPDSEFIAFDARPGGNSNVYKIPAGGGVVEQLTHQGQEGLPSWSPDGKWIYFNSTRAREHEHEVFRMRPDGSAVQQMTHNGGYYGVVTADGKWLYYSVRDEGLWKMPAEGGSATQVLPSASLYGYYFVVTQRGIYAVGKKHAQGFPAVFYPFDGGKSRTLTTLTRQPRMFPDVSPDGRWFVYTTADDPVSEIMLVENFR